MEVLVLLCGFAAIFVCGYVLMSKLDDWLAAPQNKEEHPGAGTHVRVATSRLDFVPVVSAALKELSSQHPDLHCTLVLGEEQELTGALACGSVDLALVSDHTAMSSVQYRDITLQPQSVDILDGTVEVSVLDQSSVHQRLLWHNGESRPYILKLIHLLCGQP